MEKDKYLLMFQGTRLKSICILHNGKITYMATLEEGIGGNVLSFIIQVKILRFELFKLSYKPRVPRSLFPIIKSNWWN
ncbi:MAG: hypothetical protein ACLS28_13035 [Clostridium neonatale]